MTNKLFTKINNAIDLLVKLVVTTTIILAYSIIMVDLLKMFVHPVIALFSSTMIIVALVEHMLHKSK